MSDNGNPGINKLANTLSQRMKFESSSELVLDFGSINADFSLTTNTFPVAIPKTDYTVCRGVSVGAAGVVFAESTLGGSHHHDGGTHSGHESDTGAHSHEGGGHTHTVPVPEKLRSLLPGDRVLVAWVQNEPVVVDLILPASGL